MDRRKWIFKKRNEEVNDAVLVPFSPSSALILTYFNGIPFMSMFFFFLLFSVLTLSSFSPVLPLSRYPLIIQLENHCNVQNQKLIAKSLTQILGEAIWIPKEGKPFTASTTSPSSLKNKILIEASHSYFHSSLLPVSLSLFCSSF